MDQRFLVVLVQWTQMKAKALKSVKQLSSSMIKGNLKSHLGCCDMLLHLILSRINRCTINYFHLIQMINDHSREGLR